MQSDVYVKGAQNITSPPRHGPPGEEPPDEVRDRSSSVGRVGGSQSDEVGRQGRVRWGVFLSEIISLPSNGYRKTKSIFTGELNSRLLTGLGRCAPGRYRAGHFSSEQPSHGCREASSSRKHSRMVAVSNLCVFCSWSRGYQQARLLSHFKNHQGLLDLFYGHFCFLLES